MNYALPYHIAFPAHRPDFNLGNEQGLMLSAIDHTGVNLISVLEAPRGEYNGAHSHDEIANGQAVKWNGIYQLWRE